VGVYLQGNIDIFVDGKSAIKDGRVVVHDDNRNRRSVTLVVGPGDGLAGVLNPIRPVSVVSSPMRKRVFTSSR